MKGSYLMTVAVVALLIITSIYFYQTQSSISNLTGQIQGAESKISTLQMELNLTEVNLGYARTELNSLFGISGLGASNVWLNSSTVSETAGKYDVWNFSALYAGYVNVTVVGATSNLNSVTVSWTALGIDASYNNTVVIGHSGSAIFPVLPGKQHNVAPCLQAACLLPTTVFVSVGNGSTSASQMELTVTYVY